MKNQFKNKRAFTLIELLIVIAIIGILFIVLVSKVDFATDKAKATGVQTDFRSFQMAFDTVAKENAGFNTFGFDMGDNGGGVAAGDSITINGKAYTYTNADKDKGDGIRNSYDEGDTNLDGKNVGETWTGRKVYTETWTDVWTLVKPGTSGYNSDAIFALESAINKNLDPKLHIAIASDGKITMANQARDPWKNEYHGYYITNAETDKGDRGAIVIYSNGANGKWGSAHIIENGVVTVGVPGNNVNGKDDYSIVSCYTFTNGYGEVLNATTGFSTNQSFKSNGTGGLAAVVPGGNAGSVDQPDLDVSGLNYGDTAIDGNLLYTYIGIPTLEDYRRPTVSRLEEEIGMTWAQIVELYGNGDEEYVWELLGLTADSFTPVAPQWSVELANDTDTNCIIKEQIQGIPVTTIPESAFRASNMLTHVVIPDSIISIGQSAFYKCDNLTSVVIGNSVVSIPNQAFESCKNLTSITIGNNVRSIGEQAFSRCSSLAAIAIPDSVVEIKRSAFMNCNQLVDISLSQNLRIIGNNAFDGCTALTNISIPSSLENIASSVFEDCTSLVYTEYDNALYLGNATNPYFMLASAASTGITSCIIHPDTVIINSEAFWDCNYITTIELPDNVRFIGNSSFAWCESLVNITIGHNVVTIGNYAFNRCKALVNITIPNSVTMIDYYAFTGCDNLTNITFTGTKSQWNAINLVKNWNANSGATYVQCSDGRVDF